MQATVCDRCSTVTINPELPPKKVAFGTQRGVPLTLPARLPGPKIIHRRRTFKDYELCPACLTDLENFLNPFEPEITL